MNTVIDIRQSSRPGHRVAAVLALGLIAAWAVAGAAAVHAIGTRSDRTGALLAVFPLGLDDREVLARVSRADGSLMGGTWLANVWHVYGETPEFAGALRAEGASLVLPPLPLAAFGAGGCLGMPIVDPS